MDFVHQMPVGITIPSYLTFFEDDESICNTLFSMNKYMQEWNETKGKSRQMWKTVDRVLRMEGIEDVIEGKLQNNQNEYFGGRIIVRSIDLSGQQGMNAPKLELNSTKADEHFDQFRTSFGQQTLFIPSLRCFSQQFCIELRGISEPLRTVRCGAPFFYQSGHYNISNEDACYSAQSLFDFRQTFTRQS
ncbi:hypothetical protein BLNAU_18399 [Blattamonas nauphoetae]|uniref:Uncharacterized protein n=1 Tax=Blattamonas nauphoetae TaxID=2049346 RepID=A0ABQ9X6W5_9EUKA|nr:hypothetical protein BLNAU_18399 [Blattamonas nauphoetae]